MANPNVVLPTLNLELGWPSYQQIIVERWQGNKQTVKQDFVAEEVPVALVYNGTPHVVMLASPTNLEDFALGFSITEGIIQHPSELLSLHTYNHANGIEIRLEIPDQQHCTIAEKGRNLTGRTGCGLCGATTLQQAIKTPNPVKNMLDVAVTDMLSALNEIDEQQKLNNLTGAVHAAAWVIPGKGIQHVREDVGRHNALDKLIGLLMRLGENPAMGFIVITSRASYEVVQKAACAGVNLLAAMSAPTGLAIRMAEETGLTLVGFARQNQYVVYSHPERLIHTTYPTLIQ